MLKQTLLYTGKAKSVYETDSADHLILVFRDDASAFNGEKIEQLDRKGKVNNRFNAFIMDKLAAAGIETHFEKLLSPTSSSEKTQHDPC
jgi:phosphoribosylaminoimidazole-succinocarboxamide synthase